VAVYPGPANYTFSANPASLSIKQGQSATTTISLNSVNGYAGNVSFGCTGLPAGMGCSFSPSTLTAKADGTAATSVLTITTTRPSAMLNRTFSGRPAFAMYCAVGLGSFGFVFVGWGSRQKRTGMIAVVLVLFALLLGTSACGGGGASAVSSGGSSGGTPVGSSTAVVTAVASAGGAQPTNPNQTLSFTITVTQ